jgi:uncharacterized RDD family membrane protein YckC
MPCPLCGEICRCFFEESSAASPRWLPDADPRPAEPAPEAAELPPGREPSPKAAAETALRDRARSEAPEDSPAWRLEVAARLNRYQSRRKPRPPRYPSLRLRVAGEEATGIASGVAAEYSVFPQISLAACDRALALDGRLEEPDPLAAAGLEARLGWAEPIPASAGAGQSRPSPAPAVSPAGSATAKILEFPRSWTPPPAPFDELAEPVFDRHRPRILEAEEVVPPPPALGGITIEPAPQPESEKRPGIDIPLHGAPLARRVLSALIDGVVIAAACILFGFIFSKLTAFHSPRLPIIGFFAGLAVVLWAAYQYLLVVHGGSTPGLRLARLELAGFDGKPAGRRLRRWRVLASFLSALSLGMGYAWLFLDEDSLCWHDRITHTYLAPKGPPAASRSLTG